MMMRSLLVAVLCLGAAVAGAEGAGRSQAGEVASSAAQQPSPPDFVSVAKPLLGAVVNISSERRLGRDGDEAPSAPSPFSEPQGPEPPTSKGVALGSGFLVDGGGYVVTNAHVVDDSSKITVTLHDQRDFKARLVGRDARTDLALLKIDSDQSLPFVRWGDSDAAQVGQWILAIGNPFGLGGTVTAGIISATARDIGAGPYDSFLQTDASINRGNSGGPMFNMQGEVIGVNTAIFSPNGGSIGIGFAIPSSMAKSVVEQLRSSGEVRRGWLGVAIQPVTREIAESLALPNPQGALVADVTNGSPAAKAGVKVGDVILRYRGNPLDETHRLPRLVADSQIGSEAELLIWRNGRQQKLRVQIAQLRQQVARAQPSSEPGGTEQGVLGLAVAPLNMEMRNELGLDQNEKGVVVRGVLPNSEAADRGIAAGDVIQQVDQRSVASPAEFRQALERAQKARRTLVLLLIRHGDSRHFVPVPFAAQDSNAVPGGDDGRGG